MPLIPLTLSTWSIIILALNQGGTSIMSFDMEVTGGIISFNEEADKGKVIVYN